MEFRKLYCIYLWRIRTYLLTSLGKVRAVYDESAKYQGTSLNENLLPGWKILFRAYNLITKSIPEV